MPIWILYIMRFSKMIQPVTKLNAEAGDANVSIPRREYCRCACHQSVCNRAVRDRQYYKNCDTFFERSRQQHRALRQFPSP